MDLLHMANNNQPSNNQLTTQKSIIFAVVLISALSWIELMDQATLAYLKQVMIEAIAAFGTSKIINASIATLMGVEINVGIGISGTVKPFAFLEPVAEVADDFGDLMRVSIISLITQVFLLKIVSSIYFKIFVTMSGVLVLIDTLQRGFNRSYLSFKIFMFAAFLRFSVLMAIGASIFVNNLILQSPLDAKMKSVAAFAAAVDVNSDNSILTLEEQQSLRLAIEQRGKQSQKVYSRINQLEDLLSEEAETISKYKSEIDAHRKERGTFTTRLFGDTQINALEKKVDSANNRIKEINTEKGFLIEQLLSIDKANAEDNGALNNEQVDGFFTELKKRANHISDTAMKIKSKIQNFYQNMGDIATDMMYVMAAFLFRTLIMPLLFLYVFIRVFRYIWNADVRDVIKSVNTEVREELRVGQERR